MRLSEWRAAPPHKDAVGPKIAAVVDPILTALGAGPDPHCWVAWGDEPAHRYTIFVPTEPGLISSFIRVNIPGEGPRATTKLIRWNRVAIGELAVETQAGHRILSFQLEQQVLRGVDAEADRAAAFGLRVIAAIDGRPLPPVEETFGRKRRGRGAAAKTGTRSGAPARTSSAATVKGPPKGSANASTKASSKAPARASAKSTGPSPARAAGTGAGGRAVTRATTRASSSR